MLFGQPYPKPYTAEDFGRTDIALRFAWVPVRLTDGQFVWFETYAVIYRLEYAFAIRDEDVRHAEPGALVWRRHKVLHMDQYHNWLSAEQTSFRNQSRRVEAASK